MSNPQTNLEAAAAAPARQLPGSTRSIAPRSHLRRFLPGKPPFPRACPPPQGLPAADHPPPARRAPVSSRRRSGDGAQPKPASPAEARFSSVDPRRGPPASHGLPRHASRSSSEQLASGGTRLVARTARRRRAHRAEKRARKAAQKSVDGNHRLNGIKIH